MKKSSCMLTLLFTVALTPLLFAQQTASKEGKQFTFTNTTGRAANDLHLSLSKATHPINLVADPVTGVKKVGGIYENYPSQDVSSHDYKTGGAGVPAGGSATIQFNENTRINSWYWTFDGKKVGAERNGNTQDLTVVSHVPDPFTPRQALVSVGGGLTIPGKPAAMKVTGETLAEHFDEAVFADPPIFEQLMERLGSEFIIGEPTGQLLPGVELTGSSQLMPGIALGLNLTRNVELSLGVHHFRSEWSGQFPVTVFPFQGTGPRREWGTINASAAGILADAGLRYLLSGRLRPYAEAGLRSQLVINSSSDMNLAGVELPFEVPALESGFAAYGGAGVRAHFGRNAFMQIGASLSKWPGSEYALGGNVSVGWTFGSLQKPTQGNIPEPPPVLASVENNQCECGEASFKAVVALIPRGGQATQEQALELNSGTQTKATFGKDKARKDDEVTLTLTSLKTNCTECMLGACEAKEVKVFVKSAALFAAPKDPAKDRTGGYNELKPDANGGYQMSNKSVLTDAGDVEVFIKLQYKCKGAAGSKCRETTCEKIFLIVLPRR